MFTIFSKIRYRLLSPCERDYFEVVQFVKKRGGRTIDDGKMLRVQFDFRKKIIHLALRYASSDAKVFNQIFVRNEYGNLVRTFLNHYDGITPVKIVDIGANVGLTAIYLHSFLPVERYIAIEPAPDNFSFLKRNFMLNSLDAIEAVQVAIWSKHVTLQQSSDFRDGLQWSTTFIETDAVDKGSSIMGTTFPALVEKHCLDTIDILKIDIEGAEFEIFNHTADFPWLHAVKFLAIELHPEKGNILAIKELLKRYGFVLFDSGETTIGVNTNLVC
ncbi:methyltransferase, FkbM family [Cnuella takakiae]|uniref:Methyltransferase, FkbM family n=1 Tax=Cnuella takakiae TaxID=1302690 RepID=A0A1M5DRD7_9BACT|nr:FkbM family methyltransferase [Cnuella takakiae]OLY93895.1 hypothetical protein BUE76_19925 [Cnuella takakiae]SHF69533.1 methyltransferase, FkbM family [Cnuella takakiae]